LIGIAALLGHNEPPRKLGLADASEFEGYLVGAMDEGAELVGFVVGVELVGFTVGAELVGFTIIVLLSIEMTLIEYIYSDLQLA